VTPMCDGSAQARIHGGQMYALTSLSPSARHVASQLETLRTWSDARLETRSFNHPSEIPGLAQLYDVEFIPTTKTTADVFGRHYIPIKTMVDWAAHSGEPALIINSDIELRLEPWELQRARWASSEGLCYFVRYNHDGDLSSAAAEPYGIDAFLLPERDVPELPDSFMSMGQPFWDYWLPHMFAATGRPITCVDFPAAYHRRHPLRWSWEAYHRCALEFMRLTQTPGGDGSMDACVQMAIQVREGFDRDRVRLTRQPNEIRGWVESTFGDTNPKVFLELGAHTGTDTVWLSRIPGVTMHAFEPDPRNHPPSIPNVVVHRLAIAEADGRADFILSDRGWGQVWTHSSSLKRPKNHLQRYPVTFGNTISVETATLDGFARRAGLGAIDFIWADIQGAEGEMVRGGLETLARTRYLFTEYSDDEMYEGQATLHELLAMLPDFRVVELWSDDVLLENRTFRRTP
jgi:2-O-methyltransferase